MIIKNQYEAIKRIIELTDPGKTVSLVTGCFDLTHVGHIGLIDFAANYGLVVIGINSDESVSKLKGPKRPINDLNARMLMAHHIKGVRHVFQIDEETVTDAILGIKPTYWVKGSDYTLDTLNQDERHAAESVGTKILFATKVEGYSSTKIIEKLKQ